MVNVSHHPHDKLVKKFLKDKRVAIDLLKKHLPPNIVKRLDLSTIKITSETAVDEKWKEFHNDIVFSCKTKNNKDTYIYMLIEHLSTPDVFMPVRVLRYKMNVLGKYLEMKEKPKKLPNIISLVVYNGAKEYPYARDVFSCFENEELAKQDITQPMVLLDLTDTPENVIIEQEGSDMILKLLLKWGRERDFIKKLQNFMGKNPKLFLSLSVEQAGYMYEYALFVGKGTQKNAKAMETALQQVYGEPKAKKIFSLVDYYRQQGMQQGMQQGKKEGIQQGIQKGIEAIKNLFSQGVLTKEQAEKAEKELKGEK